jgi:hypothetical protein
LLASISSIVTFLFIERHAGTDALQKYILFITYAGMLNVLIEFGQNIAYVRESVLHHSRPKKHHLILAFLQMHLKKLPILILGHILLGATIVYSFDNSWDAVIAGLFYGCGAYFFQVLISCFQIIRDNKSFLIAYVLLFFGRVIGIWVVIASASFDLSVTISYALLVSALPFLPAILFILRGGGIGLMYGIQHRKFFQAKRLNRHLKKNALYTVIILPLSRLDYLIISHSLGGASLAIYHLIQLFLQAVTLIVNSFTQRYLVWLLSSGLRLPLIISFLFSISISFAIIAIASLFFKFRMYEIGLIEDLFRLAYNHSLLFTSIVVIFTLNNMCSILMNKSYSVFWGLMAAAVQIASFLVLILLYDSASLMMTLQFFMISQLAALLIYFGRLVFLRTKKSLS